jgi:hypothetical protein
MIIQILLGGLRVLLVLKISSLDGVRDSGSWGFNVLEVERSLLDGGFNLGLGKGWVLLRGSDVLQGGSLLDGSEQFSRSRCSHCV